MKFITKTVSSTSSLNGKDCSNENGDASCALLNPSQKSTYTFTAEWAWEKLHSAYAIVHFI